MEHEGERCPPTPGPSRRMPNVTLLPNDGPSRMPRTAGRGAPTRVTTPRAAARTPHADSTRFPRCLRAASAPPPRGPAVPARANPAARGRSPPRAERLPRGEHRYHGEAGEPSASSPNRRTRSTTDMPSVRPRRRAGSDRASTGEGVGGTGVRVGVGALSFGQVAGSGGFEECRGRGGVAEAAGVHGRGDDGVSVRAMGLGGLLVVVDQLGTGRVAAAPTWGSRVSARGRSGTARRRDARACRAVSAGRRHEEAPRA